MQDYYPGLPDCLRGVDRGEMEMVFLGMGSYPSLQSPGMSVQFTSICSREEVCYWTVVRGHMLNSKEGMVIKLLMKLLQASGVWISDIHADKLEPILVVGPKQLKRYLDAYGRLEDLGMEFLDCSQSTLFAESASLAVNDQYSGARSSQGKGGQDDTGKTLKVQGGLISLLSTGRTSKVDARPISGQLRSYWLQIGFHFSGQLQSYWLQTGFHFQDNLDEQGQKKLPDTL